MELVIDRFEERYAVCEDENRTIVNMDRSKLPAGAKEGDVLAVEGDNMSIDREKTREREERIKNMARSICE